LEVEDENDNSKEDRIMRRWKKIVLIVLGAVVLPLAGILIPTLWLKPWTVDHFYTHGGH
jgi:multisubunit Na+/H+ antiporter MnhB subunit